MDINSAKLIIKAATFADDTVIIEGKHGIGKSAIVKQFAKENNYHLEELFLSHQEIADLIGIPHIIEMNGKSVTTWSVPIWLQRIYDAAYNGKHCIIFLDELNRAQIDVRQSALQLVLERQIHEHKLPIVNGMRTMIVAAINPADDYQVDELDPALLDRFLHINVEVDTQSWIKWAKKNNVNKIVTDFIIEYPNRLHYAPADGNKGSTPRSWEKLGKYLDNISNIPEEILFQIIKGKLGTELASQFYMFYTNYTDIIKVEDIEKIVSTESKNTSNIQDIADKIYELIENTEAIQKHDLADQLMEKYMQPNITNILPFLSYLYALDIEILHGFLKTMKSNDIDAYRKLVDTDVQINNKELFKKIANKIKE